MAGLFKLNRSGVGKMLKENWVYDVLDGPAKKAEAKAKGSAPVESGEYRDSIHTVRDTTDRNVIRVVADAPLRDGGRGEHWQPGAVAVSTPVVFPDVELYLTGHLRTALAAYGYPGIFVSNKRGTQTTAVWVRRDGGPTLDVVREAARVGINVYAPTEQAVGDLARTVGALVRAAADGEPVVKVEQTGGPSPDRGRARTSRAAT